MTSITLSEDKQSSMKHISVYIDIVFCTVVLPLMAMIFPIERWYHHSPLYIVSIGAWLYALYFINRRLTVPLLFHGRSKKKIGIVIICLSLAGTYALSCITLYTPHIPEPHITRVLPFVAHYRQAVWSLFMIVTTFSFAVGLLTQANLQRAQLLAAESDRDKAEIELYKAQIKPHFMFNTLNSLYGLFLTNNERALTSLEKFISMMQYLHSSSSRDHVTLRDEMDYISQYIELQSLRLNDMTHVDVTLEIENHSLLIPPMLLVTFVENCFKHGISSVEKSTLNISLHEHDGHLSFVTRNHIFPKKRIGEHTGIDNCRRRLELLYPGKHNLCIDNDGTDFRVELHIDLIPS